MKKMLVIAGMLAAAIYAVNAPAAGSAAAGKAKSTACAACHGADGNSVAPNFPKLAGQNADYIVAQLHAFKSGTRKNPIMSVQAAGLSAQDMENLAAWFSSQKTKIGEADPKLVEQGRRIYLGGVKKEQVPACAACHNPEGAGNAPAVIPSLAGQHAQYVISQLQAFASGQRSSTLKGAMNDIASQMTLADMQAVASYIQGLHK